MTSLITKIIIALVILTTSMGLAQVKGNGGVICESDILAMMAQLAKEQPSTSGFAIQGYRSLAPKYESLKTAKTESSLHNEASDFVLSFDSEKPGFLPLLVVNKNLCDQMKTGNYDLKSKIKEFVSSTKHCEELLSASVLSLAHEESSKGNRAESLAPIYSQLAKGKFYSSDDITSKLMTLSYRNLPNSEPVSIVIYNPAVCSRPDYNGNLKAVFTQLIRSTFINVNGGTKTPL